MSEAFEQMKLIQDVLAHKEKVKDQGKFTLPCTLGHIELDNALVDSGASINHLSHNGREARHCWSLQRPTTSIMFGDATSKSPLGVFKNYHLKIGECIIQTDLTVMEMEEEKDLPLLLGTPFLSTVGASIDFHKQEVILHKVNSLVSYRLQPRGSDFCATIESNSQLRRTKELKGPRIEKPRLRGLELRNHVLIGHELIGLVQAPCVLDEESLQALFDEPLGRALKRRGGCSL
ncbi:unnamed protein product [Microthlaspi erraticum]|uniref:Aspartic peptidase DDI1-type domain-containing protein n=1 Tax=Microthlaspi erraticum TaxID=1685480 RepID=A0A6D2KB76_9BRAS|nr:unnamed protein product [Microthlaspi erraticum]